MPIQQRDDDWPETRQHFVRDGKVVKPNLNRTCFPDQHGRTGAKMAKVCNELAKHGDIGLLITNGTISRETLMKYLAVPEFNEQLQRIMPYIRSLGVSRLIEIVHAGADRDSINAIKMLEKGAQDAGKTGEYFFSGASSSENSTGDNVLNVQVNISDVQQALHSDPLIKSDT